MSRKLLEHLNLQLILSFWQTGLFFALISATEIYRLTEIRQTFQLKAARSTSIRPVQWQPNCFPPTWNTDGVCMPAPQHTAEEEPRLACWHRQDKPWALSCHYCSKTRPGLGFGSCEQDVRDVQWEGLGSWQPSAWAVADIITQSSLYSTGI